MANAQISGLNAAATLTGNELIEVSQVSSTVTITATTISAQASDNSYNDSGSGFVAAGFTVGMRVKVTGFTGNAANNILVGTITALTTGKMTIGGTDGDVIVDDAAGESVTISQWTSKRALASDIGGLGGAGGNAWILRGGPLDNQAPASNYATLDTRNSHPVLDFDTTTEEAAVWTRAMPAEYGGSGITVNLWCALTSATSGTVGWKVALERIDASSLDIDADSFASANTVTAVTVPGTSGHVLKMSINISNGANMDSIAAGDLFRIKISRDTANDTAAGDAELLHWEMVEQ